MTRVGVVMTGGGVVMTGGGVIMIGGVRVYDHHSNPMIFTERHTEGKC